MRKVSRRSLLGSVTLGTAAAMTAAAPAVRAQGTENEEQSGGTWDVVVVGAGTAGIVCAITAHDLGAKVCVLEKADRPDGNSIYALGTVAAWGTKWQKACNIQDSRDAMYADMMKVSAGRAVPELTATYVDNISAAADWLQDEIGVKFGKLKMTPWPRLGRGHRVVADPGMTGGSTLIAKLLAAAKKRDIPFFYEHKVVELLKGPRGEVVGAKALTDDGYKTFNARGGVLISTGGFSANPEMTDRYIGGWASRLAIRGSRNTTGENVSLTLPFFARMVNMDQFHAGPIVSETHVNPADVLNTMQGIIVDLRGERFMDEQNTYVIKAKTCAMKTIENKAFCIVDSKCPVLEKTIAKFNRLHNPYGKADTVEDLAKQVGLPPETLAKNVKAYNAAVDAGKLAELSPANTYRKPVKLDKPPFYAVPYEGGMTATFGGPLINSKAEVQNLEGKTIKGLYAAGNAAGGIFFRDYIGGSQLGGATVFGRIAARQMVERAKKNAA
jgi:fumarate reductase flavoprotein subunit